MEVHTGPCLEDASLRRGPSPLPGCSVADLNIFVVSILLPLFSQGPLNSLVE